MSDKTPLKNVNTNRQMKSNSTTYSCCGDRAVPVSADGSDDRSNTKEDGEDNVNDELLQNTEKQKTSSISSSN